jgi:hypothetical protein
MILKTKIDSISEALFTLPLSAEKCVKSLSSKLSIVTLQVFFEDGTKLKMLLEIKPPLWNYNLGTRSSELMILNFLLLDSSKF